MNALSRIALAALAAVALTPFAAHAEKVNLTYLTHWSPDSVAMLEKAAAAYAKDHPDVRVMSGRFQEIRQAMGTPKGRAAGAAYLRAFVEEMKANGFVADALKRSGQTAPVAPPASARRTGSGTA